MNRDKILEIIEENQSKFMGVNEANLHAAHEIADKFEALKKEVEELKRKLEIANEKVELHYQDARAFEDENSELEDENEALQSRIKELEEGREWISVKERKPENKIDNGFVHVLAVENGYVFHAKFNPVTDNFLDEKFNAVPKVTHWQYLPTPPINKVNSEVKNWPDLEEFNNKLKRDFE